METAAMDMLTLKASGPDISKASWGTSEGSCG